MPDVDGNTDTEEMYNHLDTARRPYSDGMNATRDLQSHPDGLTASYKARQVALAKAPHGPDCVFCQSFAGNPPKE